MEDNMRPKPLYQEIARLLDAMLRCEAPDATVENLPQTHARDAQLDELRERDIIEVANWWGIPPHKLGAAGRTSYASLEQENKAFLEDCLDPWLCQIEQECDAKLLLPEEIDEETHVIEFRRPGLTSADLAARTAFYASAIPTGYLLKNEARAIEGLNPIPGGDVPLQPLNLAPVDENGKTEVDSGDSDSNNTSDEQEANSNAEIESHESRNGHRSNGKPASVHLAANRGPSRIAGNGRSG